MTSCERAVRGHLNELWVGLVMWAIVITQHATADSPHIHTPPRAYGRPSEEGKEKVRCVTAETRRLLSVVFLNLQ